MKPALPQPLPGAAQPPDLVHASLAEAFDFHHLVSRALVESAVRESPQNANHKIGNARIGSNWARVQVTKLNIR